MPILLSCAVHRWWADWCAYTSYKQQQGSSSEPTADAAAPGDDASSDSVPALVTAEACSPGEISNKDISLWDTSVAGYKLKQGLAECRDFEIVSGPHGPAGPGLLQLA